MLQIRTLINSVPEVISVDIELLIWLAATRCLARLHASELAVLCLAKYEALSRILSNGNSRDGLGIAADLYEFDWYKDQQSTAA